MKDLVSIIIPVYNGEKYLEEAILSALGQTYENVEVLVIDDGSTDKTSLIAKKHNDKIRYIYKENGGVSSALNLGIENMRGTFFSWLSHDDLYFEDKIEQQMKIIKTNKNVEIIYAKSIHINDKGEIISKTNKNRAKIKKIAPFKFYKKNTIRTVSGCTFLLKKDVFEQVGLFDENLRYNQDSDFWTRLSLYDLNIIYLPKPIIKSRIHNDQSTLHLSHLYKDNVKISINKRLNKSDMLRKKHYKWIFYESLSTEDKDFIRETYIRIKNKNKSIIFLKYPIIFAGQIILKMKKIKRRFINSKYRK